MDSASEQSPTEGRFVLNAVIGAVATIVLGFIPLSPALGGGIAGYLQGGDRGDGLKVGAAGGLLAMVPLLLFGGLFALLGMAGGPGGRTMIMFVMFLLMVVLFSAIYLVGLSAAGGWLGSYLRERRGDDQTASAEPAADADGAVDADTRVDADPVEPGA